MGIAPDLAGFNASSRKSSRNRAFRALASNPWQRKHVSVIMGRMSRLKSTFAASVIKPKLRKKQAVAAERRAPPAATVPLPLGNARLVRRSEEHTSELQSLAYLVCRLLLEKKKQHMPEGPGGQAPVDVLAAADAGHARALAP